MAAELPVDTHTFREPPHNVLAPFDIIETELGLVSKLIGEQLSCCPSKSWISALLEHINSQRGKMLRPGLVLLCGASCERISDEHIRVAAIFEIIHNATLLHDDVIDEAEKRRGDVTVNHLYGNESAVLLGDFLLSRVFKMCAELRPAVAKMIASAVGQMCEGELNQNLNNSNWDISETEYIEIIRDKTAALFAGCCELGALLAGAQRSVSDNLAVYGQNLGTAFQIIDDVLDVIGNENNTGKIPGKDFDKAKPTLPLIHLMSQLDEKQKREFIDDGAGIRQAVISHGSDKYAIGRANDYAAEAVGRLEELPEGPASTALIDTAEFVVARVS